MIDRCFNPACGIAMRYLRDGRAVRVTREKDGQTSVEHHWLCGLCYRTHDFEFLPDGELPSREKQVQSMQTNCIFAMWSCLSAEVLKGLLARAKSLLVAQALSSARIPETSARQ
jgi:hypothetical protein